MFENALKAADGLPKPSGGKHLARLDPFRRTYRDLDYGVEDDIASLLDRYGIGV